MNIGINYNNKLCGGKSGRVAGSRRMSGGVGARRVSAGFLPNPACSVSDRVDSDGIRLHFI